MAVSYGLPTLAGCLCVIVLLYSLSEIFSKITEEKEETSRRIKQNGMIEDALKLYYKIHNHELNQNGKLLCRPHQPSALDLSIHRTEMEDQLKNSAVINADQIVYNKEWCSYGTSGNISCSDNATSKQVIEFDVLSIIDDEIVDKKIHGIENLETFINTLKDLHRSSHKGKTILSLVLGYFRGRIYRQFLSVNSKSIFSEAKSKQLHKRYNLNVLFLKDFSRSEFYRKCPETTKTLETLITRNQSTVIDFPLHHAMFLNETDALQALLLGKTLRFPGRQASLFDEYRRLGYKITRINNKDLPRTYLPCDLDKFNSNEISSSLFDRLIRKSIRSLKARVGSLRIHDEVRNLEGVTGYLETILMKPSQPVFTFSILSNVFDESSLNVAFADRILSRHLDTVAKYGNTITVVVSGKGNTRKFLEDTYHTVFETLQVSNPILFTVVPRALPEHLTEIISSIRSNKLKPVNLLDLHNVLNHIGGSLTLNNNDFTKIYVSGKQINATAIEQTDEIMDINPVLNMTSDRYNLASRYFPFRSCDDINQMATLHGNIDLHVLPCICEGTHMKLPNDTIQVALAEFAMAHINKLIVDTVKFLKIHHLLQAQYSPCSKLRGLRFMNVKSKRQDDSVITRMTITAHPILKDVNKTIGLSVALMTSLTNDSVLNTTLLNYNILEPTNRDEQAMSLNELCFSAKSLDRGTIFNETQYRREVMTPHFGVNPRFHAVDRHGCLVLIIRNYSHSVIVEAANMCGSSEFTLTLDVKTRNMRTSTKFPVKETLPPRTHLFLGYVQQTSYFNSLGQYAFITSFNVRTVS